MSYKSYQKSPNRPFDHLYDPNYLCNLPRLKKLNQKALLDTAPLHIIPCYNLMFSDQPRNFCFPQRNPLPIEPPVDRCVSKCACFVNKNLLSNVAVNCPSRNEEIKIAEKIPIEKTFRSIKCQTKYRENEVQTEPYLPDAVLAAGEICVPEIACINITTQPTLRDIKMIERNRCRRKWEKNLSEASMEEKIRQLKVIEYENYLMREKEMNEDQEERLQQVFNILDERMNATKIINEEILENLSQKNLCEVKKSKTKLREKLQRKLRQIAKSYGQIEEEEEIKIIKALDYPLFEPHFKGMADKGPTELNFYLPKSRDGKWREIFETIRNRDKVDKCKKNFKCVEAKEILEETPQDNFSTYECDDKKEQNSILIQRILKAKNYQNEIMREIEKNRKEILKNRAKFPIKCLEGIVPKIIPEPSLIDIPKVTKSEEKLNIKEISKIVDEKINDAIAHVKLIHNQNLLREARRRREIQQRQEKVAEERQNRSDEIKRKLDEFYDEMTSEIIEKTKPIAIELFAQEDAQKFIIKKAKEIDNSEKKSLNDSEIDEEVERIFKEVLIPHVMKIVSEKDEEMQALIASSDAFEDFLKNLCDKQNKK